MDSKTDQEVAEQIAIIQNRMPQTYATIKQKAAEVGKVAYALVRRGLAGQPNNFWAMEAGYVMGTPFNHTEISRDVAQSMVTFGIAHVCVFALLESEVQRGSN
jgi:hypothetical protein